MKRLHPGKKLFNYLFDLHIIFTEGVFPLNKDLEFGGTMSFK